MVTGLKFAQSGAMREMWRLLWGKETIAPISLSSPEDDMTPSGEIYIIYRRGMKHLESVRDFEAMNIIIINE